MAIESPNKYFCKSLLCTRVTMVLLLLVAGWYIFGNPLVRGLYHGAASIWLTWCHEVASLRAIWRGQT